MSNSHDDSHGGGHQEAQQNEITAPVLIALVCVGIALLVIYFWAQ